MGWLFFIPVLAASACLLLAMRDAIKHGSRPQRLIWIAALALAATGGFLACLPWWGWLAALAIGLAGGAARSRSQSIDVDHMWGVIRLRDTRQASWTAVALLGLALLDVALAFADRESSTVGWLVAALATLLAGLLAGRTGVTLVRVKKAPHRTLRAH